MEVYSYNLYLHMDNKDDSFCIDKITNSAVKVCEELSLEILHKWAVEFPAPYKTGVKIAHSGVLLLSTSHLAWHTFPEANYIHISLSTCGEKYTRERLEESLKNSFYGITSIEHVPFL